MAAQADIPASARKRQALELFAELPPNYHRMGALLSFGQDPRWRRLLVRSVAPREGLRVLDLATGTGLVAFELARRGCTVVGLDQSEPMLSRARERLGRHPRLAARLSFVPGEAEHLPFADGEFDALTFTYLLRYVDDPAATLRELARVVAPGGRIAMLEFGLPQARWARTGWNLHTRYGLPALGRLASPAWLEVGRFLGPNIEAFHAAHPDLPALWQASGITEARQLHPCFGSGLVICGIRGG